MKRIFMLLAIALMLGAAMALSGVAQAGTSTTTTLASPKTITYVCANKSTGQLFYLSSSCASSQTTVAVTSASTQFKACYLTSNGLTRKVSASTKCSDSPRTKENTISKVPADSVSLYFCVKSSDGTMYFKPGTTQPTCPTGQYAVVIGPHNQAPSAVGDTYSTDEDTTLNVTAASGVLANDSDPDGDPITAQLATGPSHGKLTLNPDGSFSYTPDANYNGPDAFTYKASDGKGGEATATVSISVNAVDDPPVAQGDSKTVAEDSSQTPIDVLANDTDPDGGTMQIASVGNLAHGKVVVAGDNLSLSYEPAADYCGQDTFSYTLNGGSKANVSVTVDCVNDAPVANNDSATVDAGGTVGGNVLTNDTDAEGDTLNSELVSGPPHGTLTFNPDGSFSYTPNADYNGVDSFTYKALDVTAYSNVATAKITVNPTGADAQCKTLAIQTLGSSFNASNYTFHGGTAGNDTFTGTDGQSEVFCGFGGDDSIGTLQAGDIFLGGDGNDSVAGNFGGVNGGAGDDSVYDNEGTFNGDEGNDHVTYNWSGSTFNGGPGDDSVTNNDYPNYDGTATGTATFNQD
jgi:VCBS repeat-containing protein